MSTPRLSVSTWSLHRQLGKPGFTGPAHGMQIPIETHNKGPISLLELPARVAEFGIRTLEICHFHLPSVEQSYLSELRAALADADVDRVVDILNDALGALAGLDDAWRVEPAHRFRVERHD